MTNRSQEFTDTADWNEYWEEWDEGKDEEYAASVSGGHFERVDRFFEKVGIPADSAFVGCGPGTLAAKVATAHPNMQVTGYDAAELVIERNREEYSNSANISFEGAALPDFDVTQQFDLVFCYSTLHCVRDSERAIENLYEHVRSEGHLIFNYPNEKYHEDHQDVEGQLRERLQLPVEGTNLLSHERITSILDADVRDFWGFVDADGPFVEPANPCVIIGK